MTAEPPLPPNAGLVITAPNGGGAEGVFFEGKHGERVQQLTLLSPAEAAEMEALEGQGIYTCERLLRDRPRVAQLCLSLMASGLPWRRITEVCHVHHYTLARLAERFPKAIEAEKQRLGERFRLATRMTIEKLIEKLPGVPIEDSADAQRMAIVAEKVGTMAELLLGGATTRSEVVVTDEWRELAAVLKDLPAGNVLEAEVLAETGGCAGKSARNGSADASAHAQHASARAQDGVTPASAGAGLPANETVPLTESQQPPSRKPL